MWAALRARARLVRARHDGTSIAAAAPGAAARWPARVGRRRRGGCAARGAGGSCMFIHAEVGWGEVAARLRAGLHHAAARAAADRAGVAGVGAGRRVDRPASALCAGVQAVAQFLAAFPANLMFPLVVSRSCTCSLNPNIWLSPLDGVRHAVVHPVQRDRGRIDRSRPSCARGRQSGPDGLAEMEARLPAGGVPELRHRRHHRQRRLVERQHRGRIRHLGQDHAAWPMAWAATSRR